MISSAENPILQAVHSAHRKMSAAYDKVTESKSQLGHVRKEIDKLVDLGDLVSEDDVIKSAGRLVGHGLGSETLAEILSTMPANKGQSLAAWVQNLDKQVGEREFQLEHIHNGMRHALGQSGMRVLAAEHLANQPQPEQQQPINPMAMNLE